jgi:cob(I)alamin adenosyltransferase
LNRLSPWVSPGGQKLPAAALDAGGASFDSAGVKIYTRTGDAGQTALLGGARVLKDDARVAAYGDVDELNAVLGLALAEGPAEVDALLLLQVQRDLFALGARLADPTAAVADRREKAALGAADVERLERAIDEREATLPALTAFILPGGARPGALLHFARTVCRRAERAMVALHRRQPLEAALLAYVNRLSDLLFVLARAANHRQGKPEERW